MTEDYKSTVKLIVKASNQQFEDQVVQCPCNWSVLSLKTHLSETYPSKPTIAEQKLIYAGQLLTDKLVLRDVLRSYDDIEPTNHIFHLVYTPKQRQMSSGSFTSSGNRSDTVLTGQSSSSTSDGLRQRNTQNVQSQINVGAINQQTANLETTSNCPPISTFGFPMGAVGNFHPNNIAAHQIALQTWMQHTYAQYINQYMNQYMSVYGGNDGTSNSAGPGVAMPQFPFIPYSTPTIPIPNIGTGTAAVSTNILTQSQQSTIGTNPQIPNQINAGIPSNDNQVPQAPQQAAAPRFPQIVQEEQENRDWLDTFYSMSRLLVLLILVYFYSSPLRCLAVLFLGVMIYLYHIGFFRNHLNMGAVEANNNIRNNRNNNQEQQQQPQNRVGEVAGAQNDDAADAAAVNPDARTENNNPQSDNSTAEASNNVVGENQNNGTSVIAFLRTFVVSFLTSILPEAPTL